MTNDSNEQVCVGNFVTEGMEESVRSTRSNFFGEVNGAEHKSFPCGCIKEFIFDKNDVARDVVKENVLSCIGNGDFGGA